MERVGSSGKDFWKGDFSQLPLSKSEDPRYEGNQNRGCTMTAGIVFSGWCSAHNVTEMAGALRWTVVLQVRPSPVWDHIYYQVPAADFWP